MIFEQGLDLLAVVLQLLVQSAQQFTQAEGQLALGPKDRLGGLELIGFGKNAQPFLGGFWPPQLVSMQELFPPAFACLNQDLRRGKLNNEVPRRGTGPIVKGLQGSWIIFHQSLLKLVNQLSALFD